MGSFLRNEISKLLVLWVVEAEYLLTMDSVGLSLGPQPITPATVENI